ncbi:hypothetical protein HDU97_002456 [Phlyctochytrium planicorne]|nr:hypothetical protein HDU97_002456 [Phlyctochytrium planicorne]
MLYTLQYVSSRGQFITFVLISMFRNYRCTMESFMNNVIALNYHPPTFPYLSNPNMNFTIPLKGNCGPFGGNQTCSNGQCCSASGTCGSDSASCGYLCQPLFGKCNRNVDPLAVCGDLSANLSKCSLSQCCTASGKCVDSSAAECMLADPTNPPLPTNNDTTILQKPAGCQADYGSCKPYQAPNFECGPKAGGKQCPSNYCCSVDGKCGQSADFCESNVCLPAFGSCKRVVVATAACGYNSAGQASCPQTQCCSKLGVCSASSDACSTGCQKGFGGCGWPLQVVCPAAKFLSTNSSGVKSAYPGDWPETAAGKSVTINCLTGTGSISATCGSDGTNATKPCNPGFVGNVTISCGANGIWGEASNACVKSGCPPFGPWPATAAGATASIPCSGLTTGTQTAACFTDGRWGLPDLSKCNGIVACPGNMNDSIPWTRANNVATMPCPKGMAGNQTAFCNASGVYEKFDTSGCKGACAADATRPLTPFGSIATYPCAQGKLGNRTSLCQNDGSWAAPVETNCVSANCTADLGWPATPSGTTASQACPKGSTGSITRACSATVSWNDPVVSCKVTSCVPLPGSTYPEIAVGASTTVPCGSNMQGIQVVNCTSSGLYSADTSKCDVLACAAADNLPETPIGQSVASKCPSPKIGQISYTCQSGGIWSAPKIQCFDPAPGPIVICGGIDLPMTRVGQTITLECRDGQIGSMSYTCLPDGSFTDPVSTCHAPPSSG